MEIKKDLNLTVGEKAIILSHSFINIMNVLAEHFNSIKKTPELEECGRNSLSAIDELKKSFISEEKTFDRIENIDRYMNAFHADLVKIAELIISSNSISKSEKEDLDKRIKLIEEALHMFAYRVREASARKRLWDKWIYVSFEDIRQNLSDFLEATAHNSRGRFGIVYEKEKQGANDYFVDFDFRGFNGAEECIAPSYLEDSIRDLTANARKYSNPGGKISVSVADNGEKITVEVSDNGRGIPKDEIEKIVGFGCRGSNTKLEETKGYGCGVTKAYYLCKTFGGRMWIDSERNKGTKMRLEIPHPSEEEIFAGGE